ncbi:MAG: hypothetical protein FWH06_05215 [Oscillospiraceae bacterium]|nr:hypothetical protein [Oscillospiraceae bacterium]
MNERSGRPDIRALPDKKQERANGGKRFLAVYSLLLFSFAALFILASYVYTSKVSEQNLEHARDSQQLSLSALQTVDAMRAEIGRMSEELDELREHNRQLSDLAERLGGLLDDALAENGRLSLQNERMAGELEKALAPAQAHEEEQDA